VRLEIADDGAVQARLVVDRVETLALLQRDARTLESAFEQAGLKPSEGGIDLTLRDPQADARGQQRGEERGHRGEPQRPERPSLEADEGELRPDKIIRTVWRAAGGVDRRI
jgi:flagellar hook-length control protein FliK